MFQQLINFKEQNLFDPDIGSIDSLVGQIINQPLEDLLREVRSNYNVWNKNLYLIEFYLNNELRLIIEQVDSEADMVSPVGRYKIVLALASNKAQSDVEKIVKYYGKKIKKVELGSLRSRSKLIIKGLHRSAIIYSMQWADRIIDENKIVQHKLDIKNKSVLEQHFNNVFFVHDTLRMYINQVEYVSSASNGFQDLSVVAREMPSEKVFTELIDATVNLLKLEGIFVPVVIKTLQDQENPYQLINYTQDLLILYGLLLKYGNKISDKLIRDKVAEEVRNDDILERFNNWVSYMAQILIKKEDLSTPFAQKIKSGLTSGLGTGKIISALKQRMTALSKEQKKRASFIVEEVIQSNEAKIAGLSLWFWYFYLKNESNESGLNLEGVLSQMKKRGLLVSEFNSVDQVKIKELIELIKIVDELRY